MEEITETLNKLYLTATPDQTKLLNKLVDLIITALDSVSKTLTCPNENL